jgi:hypothetical protein
MMAGSPARALRLLRAGSYIQLVAFSQNSLGGRSFSSDIRKIENAGFSP